jgi:hypothetical protein
MTWLERLDPGFVVSLLAGLTLVLIGVVVAPSNLQELIVGAGLGLAGSGAASKSAPAGRQTP